MRNPNVDKSVNIVRSDHAIPLSEAGKAQAKKAGQKLKELLEKSAGCGSIHRRIWISPYRRTRETAKEIIDVIGENQFGDAQESVFLGEQQFGLFEGHNLDDLKTRFPVEYAHVQKAINDNGRFWARMPLGESRFDVCARVGRVVDQIVADEWHHGICDVVIISHGVTLRSFAMMWLGQTAEWLDDPAQASAFLFVPGFSCAYFS